jgi:anti-anti-sigma factor
VEILRLEKGEAAGSFRLIGELDASNVPQTTVQLMDELRRAGQLTLDASELTFMDSQGLRMLIDLGNEALQRKTTVALVGCSGQVGRLLDVAVPTGVPGVEIVKADK